MTGASAKTQISLAMQLIRREVTGRYRGSALGLFWSLLNPLFMLAVYTFVFGVVMKSRWAVPSQPDAQHSTGEFAVILFCGLIVFQFFAEVISLAPGLIVANASYVKKIVFPIQILPIVAAGAALFHATVSLFVLLVFAYIVFGHIPPTVVLAPLAFAPLIAMVLGIAWVLASIGVYFRDMSQIVAPLVTATMFLSPVFFQRTSVPTWLQPWLSLNPLAIPVESFRNVVIFGVQPNWLSLGYYTLVATLIAFVGYQFFQKTRRGLPMSSSGVGILTHGHRAAGAGHLWRAEAAPQLARGHNAIIFMLLEIGAGFKPAAGSTGRLISDV